MERSTLLAIESTRSDGFQSIAVFTMREPDWRVIPYHGRRLVGSNHAGDVVDDKIYLAGGYGDEVVVEFDLVMEEVKLVECPRVVPLERKWMTAVFAEWRRELVYFGGFSASAAPNPRNNEIHTLNVDSKKWTELHMKGELPIPRTGHAVTVKGSNMLMYGGYDSASRYLDDLWIAHLPRFAACYWTKVKVNGRVPVGRTTSVLNYLGGLVVVFGGYSRHGNVTGDVEIFCETSAEWKCAKTTHNAPISSDIELEELDVFSSYYVWSVQAHDSIIYVKTNGVYRLSIES